MKLSLIIFSLFFGLTAALSQNTITIKTFLAGAKQQELVVFQKRKLDFLNTISYDIPLVKKLEFRTETNDFNFQQQEFLLRVSPNSLKNIKAQRQYQKTVQSITEIEVEATFNKALRKRYDLLVNLIYSKEILAIKNKQKVLFKDKVNLLKRSIALPGFDVLDLIEAEDEQQENLQDILELENGILTLKKFIQNTSKSSYPIQVNKHNMLNINNLKTILAATKLIQTEDLPQLKAISAKIKHNTFAYEREAVKSKFSLGYIQAKYGYNEEDKFKESFSLGFGFEIPLKNAARLDLNELQLDIFESESQYKNTKSQLEDQKYAQYLQIHNLIQKHQLITEQLNESQAEFALKEYSKIAEASPKAMLKLRENTLKKELILQKIELQVMQVFVEYLDFSGLLIQRPLKNYLSEDLEEF